ncbi:MAG TPA: amino acid ABC transporter permease [Anaerolineaceae bacterium]|nr:MAG: amino acid ABC transporter permease [Chloroflexi bacterium GWB2_54_36]HAL15631.1 amino acid ABC transporter permease [Anaerolineaceae bacterium]HBA90338.1 amino acid ABC transporter permease [Anaerolineaceae bacterium]
MSVNPLSALPASAASAVRTEKNERFDRWWIMVAAVAVLVILLIFLKPDPYKNLFNFVRDGVWRTTYITIISFVLVIVFGLFVGLARLSKHKVIRGIATVYVEIIRGIPMMVQIIYWAFALPAIIQEMGSAWNIPSFMEYRPDGIVMAIFGLTFGYSAYMSEVYRAGIQSISKGQMEAARSLGMTYVQAMRYIIVPQAVRVILPPMGNELITLLKDTALVSAVAIPELTRRGREFSSANFNPIETWTMVALLYLVMTLLATRLVAYLEKKARYER